MRRLGLGVAGAAGALAVVSTLVPWFEVGDFTLSLWDATDLEAVALAAAGFVAIAFAALGLARGGRETQAAVAAAFVAALAVSLADDVPSETRGIGPWVAVAATIAGVLGSGLLTAGNGRRMIAAVAAVAIGIALGDAAFEIHPDIQVIR